ncbi:MAG: hypothetical protein JKY67_13555 [Pseudomonadales bacterium]|nr:hypothetical protein [Pseudomonadales bacterium]
MTEQHLSEDEIYQYLDEPEHAKHDDLRSHLLTCSQCLNELDKARSFERLLGDVNADGDDTIPEEVVALWNSNTNNSDQASTVAKIKEKKGHLRHSLHYIANQDAFDIEQNDIEQNDDEKKDNVVSIDSFTAKKQPDKTPLKSNSPQHNRIPFRALTAIAAAIIIAIIVPYNIQFEGEPDGQLTAYQDNAEIILVDENSTKGIGFFGAVDMEHQDFSGLSFTLKGQNRILVEWPNIEDVERYGLSLFVLKDGEKEVLFEREVEENFVLIDNFPLQSKHHYRWTLNGITEDRRSFSADGGFVSGNL